MLSLLAAQSMHMYISYEIPDDHREKVLGDAGNACAVWKLYLTQVHSSWEAWASEELKNSLSCVGGKDFAKIVKWEQKGLKHRQEIGIICLSFLRLLGFAGTFI